jgi:filamentous hemagglutinin family protein
MNTRFWLSFPTLIGIVFTTQTSRAQTYQPSNRTPVADSTLGTQISGTGNNFNITGGVNKGQTLFHSFTDFSVPTNGAANFLNPANHRDIITRVTGGVFSDINGTVNTNGANFFLINPSGIVFGTNAQLNVGKAFMGSTANSLDLVDAGGRTFRFDVNGAGDSALLTVNSNVLFNPSKLIMGASSLGGRGIENYGTLQTNNDSQYIGLIGGNVNLTGGKIIAPGGRVDLGGLNSVGTVTPTEQGLVIGGNNPIWSDVSLTNGAIVSVRAERVLNNVNTLFSNVSPGSNINISVNNLNLLNSGSNIGGATAALDAGLAENSGIKTTSTGDISINAVGKVTVDNSGIKNTLRAGAGGNIGDININANSSDLKNQSVISSSTAGLGDTGKISIITHGDLTIDNKSTISLVIVDSAIGNSKGIKIDVRDLEVSNGSIIFSDTFQTNRVDKKGNAGDVDIQSSGNIKISSSNLPLTTDLSQISSSTQGQGDAGKITINTQGNLSLDSKAYIFSTIQNEAVGNSLGIDINAKNLSVTNNSAISTNNFGGRGNTGSIDINTTGDITIAGFTEIIPVANRSDYVSSIASGTLGQGDSGKITINAQGKLLLTNNSLINNEIQSTGIGNSGGIKIDIRELEVSNSSFIVTDTFQANRVDGTGNAGDIDIQASGDIKISGSNLPLTTDTSQISSSTQGQGDAGKITINTQGKLSILNNSVISGTVAEIAAGNGKSISIAARELEIANGSSIVSNSFGWGDTGKIVIDTQGKLFLVDRGSIFSALGTSAVGNSQGIKINARELELANNSSIATATLQTTQVAGKGNAGDIEVKTTGDIRIAGLDPLLNNSTKSTGSSFNSSTIGQGDAGKITIDTQGKLSLSDASAILSSVGKEANGNGRDISIAARDIELNNRSIITSGTDQITQVNGNGKSGDINLKVKNAIDLKNISAISTNSTGVGQTGNVSISSSQLVLNSSFLLSDAKSVSGGDVKIAISDKILLRNGSFITTSSGSSEQNGNGGNITISSPLLIALPGNNDIIANAIGGNGGNVNIISQGLFGIKYRPIGADFTSDITASSTFGQSGIVNITTPGTDPGKDSTELPNTTTDASSQISQSCSTSNRQNKLTVAGRGGLPPNANDPLTSDVVWQDARAASSQPAVSSVTTPVKFAPPAVGWVFDGKGKVTLVAAGTPGQPAGTSVVCPQ